MQIELGSEEKVVQIDTNLLIPHPLNQEIYGDPLVSAGFSQLVNSVHNHGILEPIIVNSDYMILSGHRRVAAALELGLQVVPIRLLEGLNKQEQDELVIMLNQHRKRPTSVMVREAIVIERNEQECDKADLISETQEDSARFAAHAGFESKRLFAQAKKVVLSGNQGLISLMDEKTVTTAYRKLHRQQRDSSPYSSLIKPSDNWNFSPVRYPRIDDREVSGYIPGDLYANCFWYFVKPGDRVVDPMAGSGMAGYVYKRRGEWMNEHIYDFDLELFDLTPQADCIKEHDILSGFPTESADYIFLDLPYLGMSRRAYSEKKDDLANMDEKTYLHAVRHIAQLCAAVQQPGQLCTVVSPNYIDHLNLKVVNMAESIRNYWRSSGYALYLETYSSRRIQQSQTPTMARMNNIAKERRLPLTDISLIMTFRRSEAGEC